ncbi:MAG TPA: hypothetical protein VFP39_09395 [Gemmatimonadales bacterium]|nr:hypothetical protein [Gemmatimonadales bacterium]
MRHNRLTVFLLFLGLALLDAITEARWLRAALRGRPVRRSGAHPFWV